MKLSVIGTFPSVVEIAGDRDCTLGREKSTKKTWKQGIELVFMKTFARG
jgi:hypothetical protein